MKTRLRGTVTSDKNAKTLKVVVERRYPHPKYGKIVRGRTVCHAHDPYERGKLGDFVEIVESRPHSKLKRWELVSVLRASDEVAVKASLETEADVPEAVGTPTSDVPTADTPASVTSAEAEAATADAGVTDAIDTPTPAAAPANA